MKIVLLLGNAYEPVPGARAKAGVRYAVGGINDQLSAFPCGKEGCRAVANTIYLWYPNVNANLEGFARNTADSTACEIGFERSLCYRRIIVTAPTSFYGGRLKYYHYIAL